MKILYLILGAPTGGVRKKIYDKAEFIRRAHGDLAIAVVLGDTEAYQVQNGDHLVRVNYSSARRFSRFRFFWRLTLFLEQEKTYRAIGAFLKSNRYDVILMRYPVADLFLYRFMKRFSRSHKIIFEHNTLEREELKLRARGSSWYTYFLVNEQIFGGKVRVKASGVVCVTHEILHRQLSLSRRELPGVVISNGFDVKRVKMRSDFDQNPSVINLLFLSGTDAPWHGADILLNSLSAYAGGARIHCFIAGHLNESLIAKANSMDTVTLLSYQSQEHLDALADKCHVGIGSLALFRNEMKEACTLKVREYWARGIPFVLGYDDTDLMNNVQMQPYFLKVDVSPGNLTIDLDLVVAFARKVLPIKGLQETLRSLAIEYISYDTRGRAYMNFFKSLCE